jgi:hypothetical protein
LPGNGAYGNSVGVLAKNAPIGRSQGIAVDTANNIYIQDRDNHCIHKIDALTGLISNFAGGGANVAPYGDGGAAISAYIDTSNNYNGNLHVRGSKLYIVATNQAAVRVIDLATNIITRFAGTYTAGNPTAGLPAVTQNLFLPTAVWADTMGAVYISEHPRQLYKVNADATKTISILYIKQPGQGVDAPFGLWGDSNGQYLYIANFNMRNIQRFQLSTGNLQIFAGTGAEGSGGDGGLAINAQFTLPKDVWGDSNGNLFVTDVNGATIRQIVISTGLITTIAGQPRSGGFSGDGGPAVNAQLSGWPTQLAGDVLGNIYVADQDNLRVRMLSAPITSVSYTIDTVAGTEIGFFFE